MSVLWPGYWPGYRDYRYLPLLVANLNLNDFCASLSLYMRALACGARGHWLTPT